MGGDADHDIDDIVVLIQHPFGDLKVPLRTWIDLGPGPRPLLRPTKAWSHATGRELPLTVVPLRYRNTYAARRAIREGRLANPWPDRWRLPTQEEDDRLRAMRGGAGEPDDV
ncbi:hypothetical protein AB0M28_14890 [Streptomyces sp. NPDC051940]|uniref:hypothetical protein n=1 Tax=Streptomyces sp. NPDC051940 TaxID=3155675 RepID=UPI003424BFAB